MNPTVQPIIFRPRQIAQHLAICETSARNMLRNGTLPMVRISPRVIGCFKTDLDKFVKELRK